jgi:hypothetical protein
MNIDPKSYIEAMQYLPQHFDEIIRFDDRHQIERIWNGNYALWRWRAYSSPWRNVGDIFRQWHAADSFTFVASIYKPYDETDDSDCRVVYQGQDLEAAIEVLWAHRWEAY